jgi:APA family basic amino acid/polyamine antiporter
MAAGLFLLRRRPAYRPAFRVPFYPLVPIVFISASLAIVVNQFASEPRDAALGLGFVLAGVPVYYLRHAHH